jgi:hypothetical protein
MERQSSVQVEASTCLAISNSQLEPISDVNSHTSLVAFSCNQIGQLLAAMRYDEERAVGLAHLIMVREQLDQHGGADSACCADCQFFFPLKFLQRSCDGQESCELLKLCNVFDTDAKLEAAFHHVCA